MRTLSVTFLNDPELVEGEFRNDNALFRSLFKSFRQLADGKT